VCERKKLFKARVRLFFLSRLQNHSMAIFRGEEKMYTVKFSLEAKLQFSDFGNITIAQKIKYYLQNCTSVCQ
jgi:hypothetical protein